MFVWNKFWFKTLFHVSHVDAVLPWNLTHAQKRLVWIKKQGTCNWNTLHSCRHLQWVLLGLDAVARWHFTSTSQDTKIILLNWWHSMHRKLCLRLYTLLAISTASYSCTVSWCDDVTKMAAVTTRQGQVLGLGESECKDINESYFFLKPSQYLVCFDI